MSRFCRYALRTTDVDRARVFYRELLGPHFWREGIEVVELPAPVAARGAPPHWLGYIGVDDVVGAALRFLESGATQLSPPPRSAAANQDAILRDPFGAIVGLTGASIDRTDVDVAWHLLSARDEERAYALYADAFGWTRLDSHDLGPTRGRHITFSWDGSPRAAGSTTDLARQPHVHPQWLFFFPTDDLERSLDAARAMDALTLPPTETATGHLVAACDDPQGGAFGLYQTSTPNLHLPTPKAY